MYGQHDKPLEQPYVGLEGPGAGAGGSAAGVRGRALWAAAAGTVLLVMTLALLGPPDAAPAAAAPPVLACYYTTGDALAPHNLTAAAALCSHVLVAFARVERCRLTLDPGQAAVIAEVVALKEKQQQLRVLLSVGGSGGGGGFAEMVRDHANRKVFIGSVRDTLRNLSLDGVDLDWEFPGVGGVGGRQRQHFSQLLRELRTELNRHRRPYLLTVAAAAPDPIVDAAYDVDQLDLYTDWVSLMTYDFHYYSKFTPFTGHNAPLYSRADERLYLATLNANHTARAYLQRGLRPEKTVLGVPSYGHSFTLVSATGAAVGSPARGYGALGSLGFVSQDQLCSFIHSHTDVSLLRDSEARVPYLTRGTEWISYDDEASVQEKAALAVTLKLAGAMVYSLNADDPTGLCGRGPFPITRALHEALSVPAASPACRR